MPKECGFAIFLKIFLKIFENSRAPGGSAPPHEADPQKCCSRTAILAHWLYAFARLHLISPILSWVIFIVQSKCKNEFLLISGHLDPKNKTTTLSYYNNSTCIHYSLIFLLFIFILCPTVNSSLYRILRLGGGPGSNGPVWGVLFSL